MTPKRFIASDKAPGGICESRLFRPGIPFMIMPMAPGHDFKGCLSRGHRRNVFIRIFIIKLMEKHALPLQSAVIRTTENFCIDATQRRRCTNTYRGTIGYSLFMKWRSCLRAAQMLRMTVSHSGKASYVASVVHLHGRLNLCCVVNLGFGICVSGWPSALE